MEGMGGLEPSCLPMTPIYDDPSRTSTEEEIKDLVEVENNSSYNLFVPTVSLTC